MDDKINQIEKRKLHCAPYPKYISIKLRNGNVHYE